MRIVKHFSRFSLMLVALLGLGAVVAACGDVTATPAPAATIAPAAYQVTRGVKTDLAQYFAPDTTIYTTFNTNATSDQIKGWQAVSDYLSNIPELKNVFQQTDLLKLANMGNYDTDIKPWIGNEMAIGVTDVGALAGLVASTQSGSMPTGLGNIPLVVAASVKDKAKLETFVTDFLTKSNLTPTTETYKGATLKTVNLFILSLTIGYDDTRFFFGPTAQVKATLDRVATASLASQAQFKKVATNLPAENLAFVYTDAQAISKSIANNPNLQKMLSKNNSTATTMPDVSYLTGQGATVAMAADGMRVDSYQAFGANLPADVKTRLSKATNPNNILDALPEKTLAFANGQDGKSAYTSFTQSLSTMGDQGKKIQEAITKFETDSGVSLQNDVANLFGDEAVVFAQPISGYTSGDKNTSPVSAALLAKVSDKAAAQASLDKIAAAIEKADQSGATKFQSKTLAGVTFKQATKANSNSSLNLGVAGNYVFFSSSEEQTGAILAAINGNATFSKSASAATFNKVKDGLPGNNQGYAYLDLQQAVSTGLATLPADQLAKTKATSDKLTEFKAVGFSTTQNSNESFSTAYVYFPGIKKP